MKKSADEWNKLYTNKTKYKTILYHETNQIGSSSQVFKCENRKICGWQFEAIFRISAVWHIGWWNLFTSVRLIEVGNDKNGHFSYFLGVRVHLIEVSFKVNKGNKLLDFGYCPFNRGCPLNMVSPQYRFHFIWHHYLMKTLPRHQRTYSEAKTNGLSKSKIIVFFHHKKSTVVSLTISSCKLQLSYIYDLKWSLIPCLICLQ